jgi:hypothetical protein
MEVEDTGLTDVSEELMKGGRNNLQLTKAIKQKGAQRTRVEANPEEADVQHLPFLPSEALRPHHTCTTDCGSALCSEPKV